MLKKSIIFIAILISLHSSLWAKTPLKFGVFAYQSEEMVKQHYDPLLRYLNKNLNNFEIELVVLGRETFDDALRHNKLDIISTNPYHYMLIRSNNLFVKSIATMQKRVEGVQVDSFGGVIFTSALNKQIHTIEDLEDKPIATMDIKSLGGYQAQAYEYLEKTGTFLGDKQVRKLESYEAVVLSVLAGANKVGFVRTGVIESMLTRGSLKLSEIKIINKEKMPHFPYILSTRLYPEWPVAVLPHVNEQTVKNLVLLLLDFNPIKTKNTNIDGFGIAQNYLSVESLAKALYLPPYDKIEKTTWQHIYREYNNIIITIFITLIVIIIAVIKIIQLTFRIRSSEERFELAVDGTQDGLFDWNMIDNTMYHSKRFEIMLGYRGRELPNTLEAWESLLHPEDKEGAYEEINKYLKNGGKEPYRCIFRMQKKDGSYCWIEGRGKALFNESGKAVRFIGFNTDISQKIEHDKKMLKQSKFAQMGEMMSMIAHQWRQPISAISAAASVLELRQVMGNYDKSFYDQQIKNIHSYTKHLSKTIEDFRLFFKKDRKKVEVIPEVIIEDVLNIVKPISPNIDIVTVYHYNDKIYVLPNEIKQVLLNLIKNAQEVLEENSSENPRIDIKTYRDKNTFYIEIKDNGGGVPEKVLDKVFDPYFTTKGELNGTGIGLYMSKIIIDEHHNGNLKVENQDGGACFTIGLNIFK